jgi:hypothetical protein
MIEEEKSFMKQLKKTLRIWVLLSRREALQDFKTRKRKVKLNRKIMVRI